MYHGSEPIDVNILLWKNTVSVNNMNINRTNVGIILVNFAKDLGISCASEVTI